jgi:hypothetical protein
MWGRTDGAARINPLVNCIITGKMGAGRRRRQNSFIPPDLNDLLDNELNRIIKYQEYGSDPVDSGSDSGDYGSGSDSGGYGSGSDSSDYSSGSESSGYISGSDSDPEPDSDSESALNVPASGQPGGAMQPSSVKVTPSAWARRGHQPNVDAARVQARKSSAREISGERAAADSPQPGGSTKRRKVGSGPDANVVSTK